jgi:hypothetical protein
MVKIYGRGGHVEEFELPFGKVRCNSVSLHSKTNYVCHKLVVVKWSKHYTLCWAD